MSDEDLIGVMNVEITPEKKENIYIHLQDDPRDLAIYFATNHDIPGRHIKYLVETIDKHKQESIQNFQKREQESLQKKESPKKVNNYFKNAAQLDRSGSSQFKQLTSQVNKFIKLKKRSTRKSSFVSPNEKKQSISPQQGSRLFYMREEIKARKEEKLSKLREETDQSNQLTFTPKLNKTSEQIMNQKTEKSTTKIPIEERLLSYGKQRDHLLLNLRQQKKLEDLFQESQFSYQPTLIKKSYENLPPYEHKKPNYSVIHRKQSQEVIPSQSFQLNLNQQKIANEVWKSCVNMIFNQLDSEQQGIIHSYNANVHLLKSKSLSILSPLLLEITENHQRYNKEQFYMKVTDYCLKHNFVEIMLQQIFL